MYLKTCLAFILLLNVSCGTYPKKETKNEFEEIRSHRDALVQDISTPWDLVSRCDGLTFVGPFSAYGRKVDIIPEYEYSVISGVRIPGTGKWNRDTIPCPWEKRGECSLECIMGAMHHMWAYKDFEAIQRTYDYMEANDWVIGRGPTEYTWHPHLAHVFERMLEVNSLAAREEGELPDYLHGYRANVVVDYIHLKGSVYGYLNSAEIGALEILTDKNPLNPFPRAVLSRFTHGDQKETIRIMKQGPVFNWSDADERLTYIWTVAVMEGR